MLSTLSVSVFFFNDTATTEIYTLSLHDALPISEREIRRAGVGLCGPLPAFQAHELRRCGEVEHEDAVEARAPGRLAMRSEEHTSELQSQSNLVCRLLLEKKKRKAV